MQTSVTFKRMKNDIFLKIEEKVSIVLVICSTEILN